MGPEIEGSVQTNLIRVRTADSLTALRLVTVPIVMWLILSDKVVAALCIYAVALATDILDGYFARRSKVIVSYGPTFDALADLSLFYGTILALAIRGEAFWLLVGGLVSIAGLVPILGLISKKKGGLIIPRLDTSLLAFSVHTTIVAHIIRWRYAEMLLPLLLIVGLYYGYKYFAFARSIKN